MKKSYSWQILLVIFAIYLILLAFFPGLNIIFDYIRFSLLLALGFLWLGTEHKNAILFCLGLAFSALYIRDITPYWYFWHFNAAPLFLGCLILGVAIHSIYKKRNYDKQVHFGTSSAGASSTDTYLNVNVSLNDIATHSTAADLQGVSVQVLLGSARIDLTQATFTNPVTYITIKNSFSSCSIRLPKEVTAISSVKPLLGEVNIQPHLGDTDKQVYITGTNSLGSLTVVYD